MIPYFDLHCDTIFMCDYYGEGLRENNRHVDLCRTAAKFAPYAQVFAVWTREIPPPEGTDAEPDILYGRYKALMGRLLNELGANSDLIQLCKTAEDAENAAKMNKAAAFISIEGAELLRCGIEELEEAYNLGARILSLCWNYGNKLTGSCMGETNRGLTQEGREYVRCANEMGFLLDMSHISEAGFWDTVELCESSGRPVAASHSNASAIHGHLRNLTDDQFRAITRLGGVAGINFYPQFLGDCEDYGLRHVEHFLSLGGEKSVCIGGDLDGITELPDGMCGVQDADLLYELMLRNNYAEDLVRDIFYGNAMRCVERSL